jgi:hypothetical protein
MFGSGLTFMREFRRARNISKASCCRTELTSIIAFVLLISPTACPADTILRDARFELFAEATNVTTESSRRVGRFTFPTPSLSSLEETEVVLSSSLGFSGSLAISGLNYNPAQVSGLTLNSSAQPNGTVGTSSATVWNLLEFDVVGESTYSISAFGFGEIGTGILRQITSGAPKVIFDFNASHFNVFFNNKLTDILQPGRYSFELSVSSSRLGGEPFFPKAISIGFSGPTSVIPELSPLHHLAWLLALSVVLRQAFKLFTSSR